MPLDILQVHLLAGARAEVEVCGEAADEGGVFDGGSGGGAEVVGEPFWQPVFEACSGKVRERGGVELNGAGVLQFME